MSLVLITKEGNAVIIDGGRPEDMPLTRELVGGRPVKAWILTHPHVDHTEDSTIKALADTDIMWLVPASIVAAALLPTAYSYLLYLRKAKTEETVRNNSNDEN